MGFGFMGFMTWKREQSAKKKNHVWWHLNWMSNVGEHLSTQFSLNVIFKLY